MPEITEAMVEAAARAIHQREWVDNGFGPWEKFVEQDRIRAVARAALAAALAVQPSGICGVVCADAALAARPSTDERERGVLLCVKTLHPIDPGNYAGLTEGEGWKGECERMAGLQNESDQKLRERLCKMLGVDAFPVGPENLTGSLLDKIESALAAVSEGERENEPVRETPAVQPSGVTGDDETALTADEWERVEDGFREWVGLFGTVPIENSDRRIVDKIAAARAASREGR